MHFVYSCKPLILFIILKRHNFPLSLQSTSFRPDSRQLQVCPADCRQSSTCGGGGGSDEFVMVKR